MKVLILDTETTDLIKNTVLPIDQWPRIVEFFGQIVCSRTGEIVRELEFICNPGHPLAPITTKITGLTNEDIAGKPSFKDKEGEVRGIIGEAEAILAHNLSYDFNVLCGEFKRCGTLGSVQWPVRRICTVQETEHMKGHRLSLSALHEELFGEAFSGAHRARTDVQALTRCFLELVKRGDL